MVGVFAYGEGGSALGGTTAVELPPRQVQRWFDLRGRVSSINVIAEPGVEPAELSERVAAALPSSARSQTADENAEETANEINDQIGAFLTPALLALAGAAVLVGAFIIFNTFSITVAQRAREFAMLRAIGATRARCSPPSSARRWRSASPPPRSGSPPGLGWRSCSAPVRRGRVRHPARGRGARAADDRDRGGRRRRRDPARRAGAGDPRHPCRPRRGAVDGAAASIAAIAKSGGGDRGADVGRRRRPGGAGPVRRRGPRRAGSRRWPAARWRSSSGSPHRAVHREAARDRGRLSNRARLPHAGTARAGERRSATRAARPSRRPRSWSGSGWSSSSPCSRRG